MSEMATPEDSKHPEFDAADALPERVGENGQTAEEALYTEYADIQGVVVQDEHGAFFVATDEIVSDIDFNCVQKIEVITNADGTKTIFFEANPIEESRLQGFSQDVIVEEQMLDTSAEPEAAKSGRRNRKYGNSVCPVCNESFVNKARLERHMNVHRSGPSFFCQLCGKTYKYEYNLFYHWRKTCTDVMAEIDEEQRKTLCANDLRAVVEEMAQRNLLRNGIQPQVVTQDDLLIPGHYAQNQLLVQQHAQYVQDPMLVHQPQVQQVFMQQEIRFRLPKIYIPPCDHKPPRKNLPTGYRCPQCKIIFYGEKCIGLHMRTLHRKEFVSDPNDLLEKPRVVEPAKDEFVDNFDDMPDLDFEG